MFSVGFSEILLILFIAYVFVGPQDLPKITRWLARAVRKIRQLILEIKQETGWDEIENETKEIRRDLTKTISATDKEIQQDLRGINDEINSVTRELDKNINEAELETFKK